MALAELTKVVKPPKTPVQVGDVARWKEIEEELGVKFPDDYRDFCLTYGSGSFLDGEIYIANAFDPDFVASFAREQERVQTFHEEFDMPYPAFPELPGAIKLGGDGLGNEVFFLARPKGEKWAILTVQHEEEDAPDVHEMPLTTFLAKIFGRKMNCNIWGEQNYFEEPRKVTFEPRPTAADE